MAKKIKRKELGLGVRALLSNDAQIKKNPQKVVKTLSNAIAMIPIEQITAYSEQPRKDFEAEPLEELAESIRVHGLIQPVTVRHMGGDDYQLISGERRLRASKLAKLKEIPAYIRIANDQEMLEMALIENIQREALNPMEVAFTYARLAKEFNLNQTQLAQRVGKNRTSITTYMGFLSLPIPIQDALKKKQISAGHAKALNGIKDPALQTALLNKIIEEKLSVRDIENIVSAAKAPKDKPKNTKVNLATEYRSIQDNLCHFLGSKVELKVKPEGKGQIVINFGGTDDLNRILELIEES